MSLYRWIITIVLFVQPLTLADHSRDIFNTIFQAAYGEERRMWRFMFIRWQFLTTMIHLSRMQLSVAATHPVAVLRDKRAPERFIWKESSAQTSLSCCEFVTATWLTTVLCVCYANISEASQFLHALHLSTFSLYVMHCMLPSVAKCGHILINNFWYISFRFNPKTS